MKNTSCSASITIFARPSKTLHPKVTMFKSSHRSMGTSKIITSSSGASTAKNMKENASNKDIAETMRLPMKQRHPSHLFSEALRAKKIGRRRADTPTAPEMILSRRRHSRTISFIIILHLLKFSIYILPYLYIIKNLLSKPDKGF